MKKILILQIRPENETCDSEFKSILNVAKIEKTQVDRIRVEQVKKFEIDITKYSAIIVGGSPFDVTCPQDKKSEVQIRIESFFTQLFDTIIEKDFPFLGICSGNGLLGNYFGTEISGKYAEPISSVSLSMTLDGEKDDLLKGLPRQFTALVGHKEACDKVPHSATLLVTSEACPVQMFRVKKNIYATQFHPEADEDEFILRIHTYKNYGYFLPEKAEELILSLEGAETPVPKEILRRFVEKHIDI